MKFARFVAAVLCLALLCGCAGQFGRDNVRFYYLKNDISFTDSSGVIDSETPDGIDRSASLIDLLALYLDGPEDDSLRSPFPENMRLVKTELTEDAVILEFDASLAELTGMDLTLACACITKTCLELTDAQKVSIRAEGTTLDGAKQITMDADSLVLPDGK